MNVHKRYSIGTCLSRKCEELIPASEKSGNQHGDVCCRLIHRHFVQGQCLNNLLYKILTFQEEIRLNFNSVNLVLVSRKNPPLSTSTYDKKFFFLNLWTVELAFFNRTSIHLTFHHTPIFIDKYEYPLITTLRSWACVTDIEHNDSAYTLHCLN